MSMLRILRLAAEYGAESSFDFSAYAGLSVQIGFYFEAHNGSCNGSPVDVSSGWYIDEVRIVTGPITFNNPENFELGLGDWFAERGTWQVGVPTSGPGSAHEGANCAATVLAGNYADDTTSRLISPPFIVPAVSQIPRLRFSHWYNFSCSDFGGGTDQSGHK